MRKPAIETAKTWNNKDLQEGAELEGVYVKKGTFNGENGEVAVYTIETKDGEKWSVFGSASLGNQFANIPEGSYVWITYKGKETTKANRTVKVFTVDYDDEYSA